MSTVTTPSDHGSIDEKHPMASLPRLCWCTASGLCAAMTPQRRLTSSKRLVYAASMWRSRWRRRSRGSSAWRSATRARSYRRASARRQRRRMSIGVAVTTAVSFASVNSRRRVARWWAMASCWLRSHSSLRALASSCARRLPASTPAARRESWTTKRGRCGCDAGCVGDGGAVAGCGFAISAPWLLTVWWWLCGWYGAASALRVMMCVCGVGNLGVVLGRKRVVDVVMCVSDGDFRKANGVPC
mmetsp:Transcript_27605/g.85558  ORF Transcript_27605/g.85558 Transcript_27605/m.85558 type:complete len:243 (-) Transcript_27605:213-941(-)